VIPLFHVREHGDPVVCACWKREQCRTAGKHPTIKNWREVATTDTDLIMCWWRAWPLANIGILMGGLTRTVTIDIDGEAGRESLAEFERLHGKLPETLAQTTGRTEGGEHLLFTVPTHLEIDRIRNRAKLAPGIDIRAEGGLIVGAPSVHESGAVYRWRNGTVPVAEMPDALFKLATSAKARQKVAASGERPNEADLERDGFGLSWRINAARAALLEAEPAIQGQNGSTACLRAACLLIRGYCLPSEQAFELLWRFYNPICVPAWSENELMHKIESAEYNVGDEAWPWRRMVPVPDLSPAGRMVDAIFRAWALPAEERAEAIWTATSETNPNPTKDCVNEPRTSAKGKAECA
jgi:hypothetical protein